MFYRKFPSGYLSISRRAIPPVPLCPLEQPPASGIALAYSGRKRALVCVRLDTPGDRLEKARNRYVISIAQRGAI